MKPLVVGTNDLLSHQVLKGRTATHFLVNREYIKTQNGTVDGPERVFYPYDHYAPDTEFVEVAIKRGVFSPCLDAVVEHLHPDGNKAEMDATYEKASVSRAKDRELYFQRRKLWTDS